MNRVEYLSEDILDEDFIKTFSPFRILQMLSGSCRVVIKDRFVTVPTIAQKIYSIIILAFVLYASKDLFILYSWKFRDYPRVVFLCVIAVFHILFVYSCILIQARFFNGDANAKFYILLQKLERSMRTDKIKELNAILYKGNVSSAIANVFLCVIAITIWMFGEENWSFKILVASIFIMNTVMVEFSCCSNLVTYFVLRIRFINAIIENYLVEKQDQRRCLATVGCSTERLRCLAAKTHDFENCDLSTYLKAIFRAYTSFQELYAFQALLLCTTIVIQSYIIFQYAVFAVQTDPALYIDLMAFFMQLSIFSIIAIFLCARCTEFSKEVLKAKKLSITILSRYCEGPTREKAKRILNIIEVAPTRFSIYGMWIMDANILIKMFNIITTIIITILQFNFL